MPGGGQPKWGFHGLDEQAAARLVAGAGIGPGDLVLDLGAGTGALTAPLVAAGARVVAVELHPGRAVALQRRFPGPGGPVRVVRADLADLRLPRRPFRVVANPPFATSAAVLRRLVSPGSRLVRGDLVLPAWLARRWSSPSAPGVARWGRHFEVSVQRGPPRSAFRPPASTGVAILVIEAQNGQ